MVDLAPNDDDYVIEISTEPIALVEVGGSQGPSGEIALADHVANPDPHPQYVSDSDLTAGLATKDTIGTAAQALSNHLSAFPHGDFTTDAEVNLLISASIAQLTTTIATLQTAIDGKANQSHTQAISTISGLPDALDSKAATTDIRLGDQRTPIDGSVTDAKIASNAAIAWSKLSKVGAIASDVGAATVSQGSLAESALQPGAAIANISGLQTNLNTKANTADLGSAAFVGTATFATAGQGTKADSAVQPGQIANFVATSDGRLSDQRIPIDGSVTDAKIGNRTAIATSAPDGLTGTLTQWLGWIANRIKAITGNGDWWGTPATTLATTATHFSTYGNGSHVPTSGLTDEQIASNAAIDWSKLSKSGAIAADINAATAAQGTLASTALQPGTAIANISGLQTTLNAKANTVDLGSAAFVSTSTFATASQGTKADSALQPATIGISVQAFNGQLATIAALAPTSGQFLRRGVSSWQSAALGSGDIPSLDVAKITTGLFDNARINWAAPGAIGSVTPTTIVATSLVTTGTITAGDRISAPEITSTVYRNNVGTGTNIAALSTEFCTGRGTGTGALGDLVFTTADLAASGASLQAVTTKMIIKGRGSVLIGVTTDNGTDRLQVAGSASIAGNFNATGTATKIGANANAFTFLALNGAAGGNRQLVWQTAAANRWNLYTTSAAESGGNAGSVMALGYYSDAGGYLGEIFNATRLGVFTLSAPATRFTGANLGFFNAIATTKPTVTGSKGGNAALASLITALATLGLVTDTTT